MAVAGATAVGLTMDQIMLVDQPRFQAVSVIRTRMPFKARVMAAEKLA